jgi:hypothetical protein
MKNEKYKLFYHIWNVVVPLLACSLILSLTCISDLT